MSIKNYLRKWRNNLTIDYKNKDFLWTTLETSGNLLLGDKTEKEIIEEEKEYALNKLLEDQEAIDLIYKIVNGKQ